MLPDYLTSEQQFCFAYWWEMFKNGPTYHKIKKYYYICILYDMLSIHYGQKYYGNTSSEKIGRKYEDCR